MNIQSSSKQNELSQSVYRPGYKGAKLAMLLAGLLVLAFGISQLIPPLHLVWRGERALAEATQVVKAKPGRPDQVFKDDIAVRAHLEVQDRSYTFWNEFALTLRDGRTVPVRCPIGSQLKPLFPLLDAEGLPTSVWVCYDRANPQHAIFPSVFSTWYAPVVLTGLGLACCIIAILLYYWADKPIELPRVG
jgi:hypothetical protein